MEEWLVYVDQELWRDISSDCSEKVEQLLRLLTDGTPVQPLYADKALRLQLAIDRMGSPEVRRQQAEHICQRAFSHSMDELLCYYKGEESLQAVLTLPAELLRLYLTDSEALMGRLWYYRLPREQVRGVLTLLALMVRLCFASSDLMGENADDAEGAEERRNNPTSAQAQPGDNDGVGEDAKVRIAKGCKAKLLVILNAVYHAGWLTDGQDRPLTNRDKALNDILRRAFGETKPTQIGCTIFPAREPNHAEKHRAAIEELLKHLPEEKE